MLQAKKEEPPLSVGCRDKFLIESAIITPEREWLSSQDFVGTVFRNPNTLPLTNAVVVGCGAERRSPLAKDSGHLPAARGTQIKASAYYHLLVLLDAWRLARSLQALVLALEERWRLRSWWALQACSK